MGYLTSIPKIHGANLDLLLSLDEASMSDEESSEELAETVLGQLGGVEPAVRNKQDKPHCPDCSSGVEPAAPSTLVGGKAPDHRFTHKPMDPACDACVRGKMKNLRKYAGAFNRPLKQFGDLVTMDHCPFMTRECSTR